LSGSARALWLATVFGAGLVACDAPSSSVDPNDLKGVFEKDAGAASASAASASAKPRASASAAPAKPPTERSPSDPGCVADRGSPTEPTRVAGRPACRAASVREWRDPSGAPRYACLYAPGDAEKRGKRPLLVYFHGTGPGLDDPASLAKLTDLRKKLGDTDLGGEGKGFNVLAIQGRALGGMGLSYDADHVAPDNLDKVTADHFVDEAIGEGIVDERRIHAVGLGKGGQMAITYAMLRADRVAAFAAFAPVPPKAVWSCPGPPPPGLVVYRACDAVASCDVVEGWLLGRDEQRAETKRLRLDADGTEEPSCTVRNKCTPKKAEANHHRWPKGREKDILAFLAGYVLDAP
jgi:predicted esterase